MSPLRGLAASVWSVGARAGSVPVVLRDERRSERQTATLGRVVRGDFTEVNFDEGEGTHGKKEVGDLRWVALSRGNSTRQSEKALVCSGARASVEPGRSGGVVLGTLWHCMPARTVKSSQISNKKLSIEY